MSLSNLMALRVIVYLYTNNKRYSFYVLFGSMMSSILFHLIETDEVAAQSPVDRPVLSGIFDTKVSYGYILLFFDRVFAVLAAFSALVYIRERGELMKAANTSKLSHGLTLNWSKLIVYSFIALIVTIYSELCSSEVMYVISHSVWHVMAYHIAYCVFNPENSSLYK